MKQQEREQKQIETEESIKKVSSHLSSTLFNLANAFSHKNSISICKK